MQYSQNESRSTKDRGTLKAKGDTFRKLRRLSRIEKKSLTGAWRIFLSGKAPALRNLYGDNHVHVKHIFFVRLAHAVTWEIHGNTMKRSWIGRTIIMCYTDLSMISLAMRWADFNRIASSCLAICARASCSSDHQMNAFLKPNFLKQMKTLNEIHQMFIFHLRNNAHSLKSNDSFRIASSCRAICA